MAKRSNYEPVLVKFCLETRFSTYCSDKEIKIHKILSFVMAKRSKCRKDIYNVCLIFLQNQFLYLDLFAMYIDLFATPIFVHRSNARVSFDQKAMIPMFRSFRQC